MSKKEDKKAKKAQKAEKKAEKKANKKPMELSVATTLVSCICIVLCVAIVAVSLSISIQKISDNKVEVAKISSGAVSEDAGDSTSSDDSSYDSSSDATVDSGDATIDSGDTSADSSDATVDSGASSDAPSSSTDTKVPSQSGSSSNSSSSSSSKAPSSVAEILTYYNTATKKVADKKLAFHKERVSVEKSYEAGVALKSFKSLVYQFMGVGEANKYVADITKEDADSYHKYFLASSLTPANVKSAKLDNKNGIYNITINLKDGASSVKEGKVVSAGGTALDKCGVSAGENDKDYWDHKNAQNVFSAISEIADKANINESYSNAVVKATVDSKTGNLTSLTVTFDFKYDISNVVGSKGLATGSSTVNMTGFKW